MKSSWFLLSALAASFGLTTGYYVCPKNLGLNTTCASLSTGCYCLVQMQKTWSEANVFCRSANMQLVSIETQREQQLLHKLVSPIETDWWWTSGSDEGTEGHWTWTATGRAFDFERWARGDPQWGDQPNGGVEQNFMKLRGSAHADASSAFHWYDIEDTNEIFSICEY